MVKKTVTAITKQHTTNCRCGFKHLLEGYKLRTNPKLTKKEYERWIYG